MSEIESSNLTEERDTTRVCNLRERPLLLRVNGKLYDVALFASKHPGGQKVLKRLAGEDVDEYMNGTKRILGVKHQHSATAYRMLEKYAVDMCYEGSDDLLSDKPMLNKVAHLGDRYWTWIHQPYEGTLRLFESDVLESMTRTSWWMVPLVWLPVVVLFTVRAFPMIFQNYGFIYGLIIWAGLFTLGVLSWTLLEYILHRFAFHWQPNPESYFQITLHFLLHGLHHKTPMDGDRLVFPPVPAAVIVAFFYCFYTWLLPYDLFCCFGAGKLFGYIIYDCSHYYFHHADPLPGTNLHFRKVYHNNHHFKHFDLVLFSFVAFGISTILWDYVFNTVGAGPQ
uniref:Fatty acid 2-hydroxylase n=1 Tax=Setaria digitata TaxID=48799 RepID=A0A915PT18_9BILA